MTRVGIGMSVPRVEDARHLTGRGRFIDDVRIDGECHGFVLRSPWPHAEILSLDTAHAKRASGVLLVLTAADYRADGLGRLPYIYPLAPNWDLEKLHNPGRWPLAEGCVRHVGDAVAFVVAETAVAARDAAELIEVEYRPLPSLTATADAASPGAPCVWEDCPQNVVFRHGVGDAAATEAAFAKADHVVRERLVISRVSANTLECRGMIADHDPQRDLTTVHASAQSAFGLRRQLAGDIFRVPEDKFRVIIEDVGGSFGMKGAFYPEYALVTWAARKLGRPVRWIGDRSEALMSDYHSRDNISEAELALDRDGNFLAIRVRTTANLGAYPSTMPTGPTTSHVGGVAGVYTFRAGHVEITGVYTHTNATGSYRGAGRPEATYLIERIIDVAARELGRDAADLRRQNMIRAEALPWRTPFYFRFEGEPFGFFEYDSGDFVTAFDTALRLADYRGFEARRQEAAARGRLRGIGTAYFIEMAASPGFEFVELHVAGNGRVTVYAGTANNGQGHHTAYTQVVCGILGIDPGMVTVVESDTGLVRQGSGTSSSRTSAMGGTAATIASHEVIEQGRRIAAGLLEASESDIAFTAGTFTVHGTDRRVSLADVAVAVPPEGAGDARREAGLWAEGIHRSLAPNWPNGCHVCEIEIDPETGRAEIVAYTVVDDAGTVINPMLLEGQVYGGVAQGIGQVMMEAVGYDPATGQLLTGSFLDYAMPRATDIGEIRVDSCPAPTRTNPLGVKGGGESGTIGSLPCVMNAINDALAPLGIRGIDMPATPARLWATIAAARGASDSFEHDSQPKRRTG